MCRSKGVVIIAKLCLGTVQFGMHYGIHNVLGRQPTDEEVFSILDTALAHGICEYDAASAYGMAEDILGRYGLTEKYVGGMPVRIISKLRPNIADDVDDVIAEVHESLRRLRAERIYGYMLHRASDMERSAIMEGLMRAKENGLIEQIGVSVYEVGEALCAARTPWIDSIQVPYNALDRRLDAAFFFDEARVNGKCVYARSAFLQGLLLMQPDQAEMRVVGSGTYVASFQTIAKDGGFSPDEAALLYSLSHEGIDYVVFGVDTAEQLCENVTIQQKKGTFHATYENIRTSIVDVPKEVIVPTRWKKMT